MMRRHRPGRSKFPAFILGLAGILICVTCMSAETLLVILSLLLIALGVWLMFFQWPVCNCCIFVICNFLVENKSDDDFTMSMLDYNAYADGYSLSETYYSEDDFGSMSGTIAPGKKMKGALAFEVKKNYKKLELDFALGDLFGDEKVKFVNKK